MATTAGRVGVPSTTASASNTGCGAAQIFTVGHSNHTLPSFFALLTRSGCDGVIDVRSVPHSKRFPHFSQKSLRETCAKVRITLA